MKKIFAGKAGEDFYTFILKTNFNIILIPGSCRSSVIENLVGILGIIRICRIVFGLNLSSSIFQLHLAKSTLSVGSVNSGLNAGFFVGLGSNIIDQLGIDSLKSDAVCGDIVAQLVVKTGHKSLAALGRISAGMEQDRSSLNMNGPLIVVKCTAAVIDIPSLGRSFLQTVITGGCAVLISGSSTDTGLQRNSVGACPAVPCKESNGVSCQVNFYSHISLDPLFVVLGKEVCPHTTVFLKIVLIGIISAAVTLGILPSFGSSTLGQVAALVCAGTLLSRAYTPAAITNTTASVSNPLAIFFNMLFLLLRYFNMFSENVSAKYHHNKCCNRYFLMNKQLL